MPTELQFRRDSELNLNGITGLDGEIFVNTDDYSLRVHDGATQGGASTIPTKNYVDIELNAKLDVGVNLVDESKRAIIGKRLSGSSPSSATAQVQVIGNLLIDGNGFGESKPTSNLVFHIENSSTNGIIWRTTQYGYSGFSAGIKLIGGSPFAYGGLAFYTSGPGDNTSTQNATERFRIAPAGNVGIGTTTPSNKLDVNGGIDANTLNTGQGDNELYAMNQNVRTTDSPTFDTVTANSFSGNGSTLTSVNADLLDGQNGTYYLNYNNFTNTPTIGNGALTISGGSGLTGSGTFDANATSNNTITLNHADTSTQSSLNSNTQGTVIQNITLDTYGHITGMSTVDLSTDDVDEGNNLYFTTGRIDSHLSGGTGVDYSNGTISIGQPVDETDDVTFSTVSAGSVSADTFDVNQMISLGDHIDIQEEYATKTTSSTDFTIASFSSSIYSSAKLIIEAEDYDTSGNSDIQIQEFLIVSKGADVFMTEYGIVSSTPNPFVTYSTINNGGFIEIDASFSVSGDVNFKTSMTLFKKKPGIA